MKNRETKARNDMFFACSLIEKIARDTNNTNTFVANSIGEDGMKYILKNAQVLHCENIDKVSYEIAQKHSIKKGNYDINKYEEIPTFFTMGRVYSSLVYYKIQKDHERKTKSVLKIYNSPVAEKINNYDANMMRSNIPYLYASYKAKKALEY